MRTREYKVYTSIRDRSQENVTGMFCKFVCRDTTVRWKVLRTQAPSLRRACYKICAASCTMPTVVCRQWVSPFADNLPAAERRDWEILQAGLPRTSS
eukprot:5745910-Amphidinium_carterae.2